MIVKAAGLLGGQTVAAESGVWDVMPPTRLRECLSSSMRTLRPIVSGSMVLHPFLGGIDGWYDVEICILAQCILISQACKTAVLHPTISYPAEYEETDDLVSEM